MKIMIVTPYFAPKVGGLENYAFNIAKGLQRKGNDVFIVTSNHFGEGKLEDEIEGLRVIRLAVLFKFSNTPLNPLWYFQLRKIIKIEMPDVINAHAPVPGLADLAVAASGSVPTILTYHAATLRKPGSIIFNIVAKFYEIIQRPTFIKATGLIAVSDYVKQSL